MDLYKMRKSKKKLKKKGGELACLKQKYVEVI